MMENIQFESNAIELKVVLGFGLLQVPEYQRNFAWKKEQLEPFWESLVDPSNDPGTFCGTVMLLQSKETDILEIVDGQQRLTVCTLILCAVRDILQKFERASDTYSDRLHKKYIQDMATNSYRLIQKNNCNDFLVDSVLSFPRDLGVRPVGSEARSIHKAYEYLRKLVFEEVKQKRDDGLDSQIQVLLKIRDNILKLTAIKILLHDESLKYEIFESVNSMGSKLEPEDLIKNLVICNNLENQDAIVRTWESSVEIADQINMSLTDMIRYYWNARFGFTVKRRLFEKIRSQCIRDNLLYTKLPKEIQDAVEIFKILRVGALDEVCGGFKDDKDQKMGLSFYRSVEILRQTNVKQHNVLFYILFNFRDVLESKRVTHLARVLANFSVAYFSLCSKRANRVEKLFSAHALDICQCAMEVEASVRLLKSNAAIDRTIEALCEIWPSEIELQQAINDLQYSNTKKVQLALLAFFSALEFSKFPDQTTEFIWEQVIVEHIQPLDPPVASLNDEFDSLNCIGNLCLLNLPDGQSKGNMMPSDPPVARMFKESDFCTTREIVNDSSSWDQTKVTNRLEDLLQQALQVIGSP